MTGWSNDFCDDRCVVADTAAAVENSFAGAQLECVQPCRKPAWQSIVQIATHIDSNQNVFIKATWVVILGGLVVLVTVICTGNNLPRAWPQKILAPNAGKRINQR